MNVAVDVSLMQVLLGMGRVILILHWKLFTMQNVSESLLTPLRSLWSYENRLTIYLNKLYKKWTSHLWNILLCQKLLYINDTDILHSYEKQKLWWNLSATISFRESSVVIYFPNRLLNWKVEISALKMETEQDVQFSLMKKVVSVELAMNLCSNHTAVHRHLLFIYKHKHILITIRLTFFWHCVFFQSVLFVSVLMKFELIHCIFLTCVFYDLTGHF